MKYRKHLIIGASDFWGLNASEFGTINIYVKVEGQKTLVGAIKLLFSSRDSLWSLLTLQQSTTGQRFENYSYTIQAQFKHNSYTIQTQFVHNSNTVHIQVKHKSPRKSIALLS